MKPRIQVIFSEDKDEFFIEYHFRDSHDPLKSDRANTLGKMSFGREASEIVFKQFRKNSQNASLKTAIKNRHEWTTMALKDPYLTEEERILIKQIKDEGPKVLKDNQFTAELASAWKPLHYHLTKNHGIKKKEAQEIVLSLIEQLFPHEKQIKGLINEPSFAETFEKALRKSADIEPTKSYTILPYPKR